MASTRIQSADSKLSAIMFADIHGYGRLVDADEHGNLDRITRSIKLFRDLIGDYGGQVKNIAGDGILAIFDSASQAIRFAAQFQRELKNEVVWNDTDEPLTFRIGINLGETTFTDDGLYGHSVNIAARIQALAEPGGICITDVTKKAVHDWSCLALRPMGTRQLKNVEEPIEVFAVELKDRPSPAPAVPSREVRRLERGPENEASIAILPFANRTQDPADHHLCDGMTDDIISGLCRFRDLAVIARHSSHRYIERTLGVDQIGRELGVRYLLDGSLQRRGRELRVRVQLNETESGNTIWTERYDGSLDEVFGFQDEITDQITALLAIQIHSAERRRAIIEQKPDLRAYGLILRGQDLVFQFMKETNFHARRLFEQAVDLDPGYSRGYAAISRTFNLAWRYAWVDVPSAALDKAVELASAAISYDDLDARGFAELGYASLYRKEHDESLAAYERAFQLNPNDADLLAEMGDSLVYSRQAERAVELLQRAIRLNPYHPDWYLWYLGDAYFHLGDYEKTITVLNRMRNKSEAHRLLASSHALLGQMNEAGHHAKLLMQKHPNFSIEHWRNVPPNKYPDDLEIFIEGLRKAGLK